MPDQVPDKTTHSAELIRTKLLNPYRFGLVIYSIALALAMIYGYRLDPIPFGAIWLALAMGSLTRAIECVSQSLRIDHLEQHIFSRSQQSAVDMIKSVEKEMNDKTDSQK